MCDPKSHRRCINKGILWRNNKNQELFISTVVSEPPAITLAVAFQSWYAAACQSIARVLLHKFVYPLLSPFCWSVTFCLMLLLHCCCTLSGYSAAHLPTNRQPALRLFILRAYLLCVILVQYIDSLRNVLGIKCSFSAFFFELMRASF